MAAQEGPRDLSGRRGKRRAAKQMIKFLREALNSDSEDSPDQGRGVQAAVRGTHLRSLSDVKCNRQLFDFFSII